MKYTTKTITQGAEILANDHYVAVECDCTDFSTLATDGVIKAGTIIPANDETAKAVLLNDVVIAENPNGTAVVHGFIRKGKLPAAVDAEAKKALAQITFLD